MDAALDFLMLALAVRLGGGSMKPLRLLLGAAAGAAIAWAARALALERIQMLCLWLPCAMTMMLIARGREALMAPVKNALLLMCAAGLLGGMVLSLSGALGSLAGGYVLGSLSALGIGLCAARVRRTAQNVHRARVTCICRGQRASFDAIIDSGNTLRDYLTHLPVIVIDEKRGRKAFDLGDGPLRPIYAQTAGGRQRMDMIVPQEIILQTNGQMRVMRAALALSPWLGEDVPALVPSSLLDMD